MLLSLRLGERLYHLDASLFLSRLLYGEVTELGIMSGVFGLIYALIITTMLPWVVQYQRKE